MLTKEQVLALSTDEINELLRMILEHTDEFGFGLKDVLSQSTLDEIMLITSPLEDFADGIAF